MGHLDSIPGLGRPPGEGNGYPLQYSCLKNSMDREAWWPTIHGVTKSQTQTRYTYTHKDLLYRTGNSTQYSNDLYGERILKMKDICTCGLPRWLSGKEAACPAGDTGSIPGLGRSPGEGNGYPLQHSCLGNPMDRGAWRATVHEGAKSWT